MTRGMVEAKGGGEKKDRVMVRVSYGTFKITLLKYTPRPHF